MTNITFHLPIDLATPAPVNKQSVLVQPVVKPVVATTPTAGLAPNTSVQPAAAAMNGFKTLAKLLVLSVGLTSSPALAAQGARHDAHRHSYEQQAAACRHSTFGTCMASENCTTQGCGPSPTQQDWPAGMILD